MTAHTCPLNKRACRCNPEAMEAKFRPCMLARRIGTTVRMLGAEREAEAIAATHALRRLLPGEGLAFSDVATLIENADGEIEQLKYSDSDAEAIFTRGVEEGSKKNAGRAFSTDFFDDNGAPRWLEIAKFCDGSSNQLEPREQTFVAEMVMNMQYYGSPRSYKQGGYLLSIFYRLRGSLK